MQTPSVVRHLSVKRVASQLCHPLACDRLHSYRALSVGGSQKALTVPEIFEFEKISRETHLFWKIHYKMVPISNFQMLRVGI